MKILKHNQDKLLARKEWPKFIQMGTDTCVKVKSPFESEWLDLETGNIMPISDNKELGIAWIARVNLVKSRGYAFISESQWNSYLNKNVNHFSPIRA